MANVGVLDNPFSYPTGLLRENQTLEKHENETRFVPSELLPHTITLSHEKNMLEFQFDYLMSESIGEIIDYGNGCILSLGKYTNKVISVKLAYTDSENLEKVFQHIINVMTARKEVAKKESLAKHFDLLIHLFDKLRKDKYLKQSLLK